MNTVLFLLMCGIPSSGPFFGSKFIIHSKEYARIPYILACHLQIDTDTKMNPAYHFDADPDPGSQNDADPDPQHCF
jgi:hypothetical protein